MRVPLIRFDDVVEEPGFATVTLGAIVVRCQVDGEDALLFPERSVKQRDVCKALQLVD